MKRQTQSKKEWQVKRKIYLSAAAIVLLVFSGAACAGASVTPAPTTPPPKAVITAAPPVVTLSPTPVVTPVTTIPARPAVPAWQEKWEKSLAAAKQEGSVRMYNNMGPLLREEIAKGFKQNHGFDVEFVTGQPADIARRFISERDAGQSLADIFNAGATTLLTVMKPKGLLSSFVPELILPEVTDPKAWRDARLPFIDKDSTVVGMVAAYESYALRNTELVKDSEIVSFKDLLDPKWKGKMVINDPSVPGAGASFVAFLVRSWGEEEAKEYLRGLVKQEVFVTRDARLQVEWVARGKYPIALAARPDNVVEFMVLGSPIAPIRAKEGGVRQTVGAAISLPTNPPHPNARTIFVNWLLSREGQTDLAKGSGQPSARVDVPTEGVNPIFFAGPGDKVLPETEEHFFLQDRMFPVVREILAPLIK